MIRCGKNIQGLRKEAGLAFLWVLFLLVIMSAFSLAFLQKTSISTSAAVTRGSTMQAHYLARSAANHALWSLLNDPGFNSSETVYNMHGLGNGRYGYKVRRPTLTKFGTVATVGGVSNVVTKQGYVQYLRPYDIVTVYSKDGAGTPTQRRLLGATWWDPADAVDNGAASESWVVLKGAPTRKEMIMGTLDPDYDINFAVWDGAAWGNLTEFTQDAGTFFYQCFDIAYESQSGDALVLGRFSSTEGLRYNIWDGNAWAFATPQTDAELNTEDNVTHVDMASHPSSDEILIVAAQSSKDIKVFEWDGSDFTSHGEIDTDMEQKGYGSVDIVYEQQSGDALVLWNHKWAERIYYSLWSGASLSPVEQAPDFDDDIISVRAAADPNSDYIFVVAEDDAYDLNVAVWDGHAWVDSRELETAMDFGLDKNVDVAWEHSGEEVMVAWGSSASGGPNVRYFTWRKGTALADHAVQSGPNFQNNIYRVRLLPISNTEKIILLVKNAGSDLRYSLWTGNAFLGDPGILLESSLAVSFLPFDFAESGVTYTGGSG